MEDPTHKQRSVEDPLPDDVLLDILVRVKDVPAALFRCATVCKRWRRLVADPGVLQCCWPPGTSSFFAGFFTKKRHHLQTGAGQAPIWTPCFFPVPRSAMGPRLRALTSFVPAAPAGMLDQAVPISSRRGVLLVCLDADALPNAPIVHLAVCNLLSGTFQLLPPLMRYTLNPEFIKYAILTGADYNIGGPQQPMMPHFKVLVVDVSYNIKVYMFSSDEGSWSRTCHEWLDGFKKFHVIETDVVVRACMAHCLAYSFTTSSLCTIDVNTETGHVSATKIVTLTDQLLCRFTNDEPCIVLAVDSCGELALLWLQKEHPEVEIWKRQDKNGSADMALHSMVVLKRPNRKEIQGGKLCILGEKCGTILVNDGHQRVYVANLETGVLEEVMNWSGSYLGQGEPVTVEMDWPALFVSRLGSR